MFHQLLVHLIVLNLRSIHGSLCVTKVIVRVPRENDIGLIFDLTVANRITAEKKEALQFVVSADGLCTLNTTKGEQVKNAGRIFGGDFGMVEPGKSETVSLVWPTVTLYNRVGFCPIIISASNVQNDVADTKQLLHFDTRFEILDPGKHTLRRRKDFMDCQNWDKDYFRNCTPLNCDERYFGKRSFYNHNTEQCEPVPPCSAEGEYYDFYANECVDENYSITEEELEQIKQGKFDDNYLELKRGPSQLHPDPPSKANKLPPSPASPPPASYKEAKQQCTSSNRLSLVDFNNCFQHLHDGFEPQVAATEPKIQKKKSPSEMSLLNRFYYDWYLPWRAENIEEQDELESGSGATTSGSQPLLFQLHQLNSTGWLKILGQGLLIIILVIMFQVAVTLGTYLLVCVAIYGFLELMSCMKTERETSDDLGKKLTPRETDSRNTILTSESLMSNR